MKTQTMINGVNIELLQETVEAIREQPELARFEFRARNRWINGGHSRTSIRDFYGAGREDESRTAAFTLDSDEPAVLLGYDHAANPGEFVLHALAACLTTSIAYHCAANGIPVESIQSSLHGDVDLQGFLGLDETCRSDFKNIRVKLEIQTDAPTEQLKSFCFRSPVHDMITNSVPIDLEISTSKSE